MNRNWQYVCMVAVVFCLSAAVTGGAGTKATSAVGMTGGIRVFSYENRGFVMTDTIVKTEADWKKQLTPEQFRILRKKGTELAGTGKYAYSHEHGVYRCAGCGLDLFRSEDKYESGTGWPSFVAPLSPENITTAADNSLFSRRTEVLCRRCGGHLGHVFDDGPKPTGLRYCMNSAALEFAAARK